MRLLSLYLLAMTVLSSSFSIAQSSDAGVPLWPIYYQSDDGRHVEAAASLYGRRDSNWHVGTINPTDRSFRRCWLIPKAASKPAAPVPCWA